MLNLRKAGLELQYVTLAAIRDASCNTSLELQYVTRASATYR